MNAAAKLIEVVTDAAAGDARLGHRTPAQELVFNTLGSYAPETGYAPAFLAVCAALCGQDEFCEITEDALSLAIDELRDVFHRAQGAAIAVRATATQITIAAGAKGEVSFYVTPAAANVTNTLGGAVEEVAQLAREIRQLLVGRARLGSAAERIAAARAGLDAFSAARG